MYLIFNIFSSTVGLVLLAWLIIARGIDIKIGSYVFALSTILICSASIFFSYYFQQYKLILSGLPFVLISLLLVPIFISPYFLLTKFYSYPAQIFETGYAITLELRLSIGTGNKFKKRILNFKKRFPPAYICQNKRSGVIDAFLVKNDIKNALIRIEFSRAEFWVFPVGLIQGNTLLIYDEQGLENCINHQGKSVLDDYQIISSNKVSDYGAFGIDTYQTAFNEPEAVFFSTTEGERQFIQLYNFATSPDIVEKINTELKNIKPDNKLCLRRYWMSAKAVPPHFLSVTITDVGNCQNPKISFPEYSTGILYDLKYGSKISFSDLFNNYQENQIRIKEIIQKSLTKKLNKIKDSNYKLIFSEYVKSFSAKDDSQFTFTINPSGRNDKHAWISFYPVHPLASSRIPGEGIDFTLMISSKLFSDYLKREW